MPLASWLTDHPPLGLPPSCRGISCLLATSPCQACGTCDASGTCGSALAGPGRAPCGHMTCSIWNIIQYHSKPFKIPVQFIFCVYFKYWTSSGFPYNVNKYYIYMYIYIHHIPFPPSALPLKMALENCARLQLLWRTHIMYIYIHIYYSSTKCNTLCGNQHEYMYVRNVNTKLLI